MPAGDGRNSCSIRGNRERADRDSFGDGECVSAGAGFVAGNIDVLRRKVMNGAEPHFCIRFQHL